MHNLVKMSENPGKKTRRVPNRNSSLPQENSRKWYYEMEKIPGKQGGTVLYVYQDYSYNLDPRSPEPSYRCASRRKTQCKATATQAGHPARVTVKNVHNHPCSPLLVKKSQLIEEMLQLAKQTVRPITEIFAEVCRSDPAAGSALSLRAMKARMESARGTMRPALPQTMLELSNQVTNQDTAMVAMFKGHVVADDGAVALIFTSDSLLAHLNQSSEIFVDGTFSVTPRVPLIGQLYSIHTRFMDTGIATVFVLCESRTAAMYRAIWGRISELAPGLSTVLRFVMGDYERAAVTALREQFPGAKIHGCWFHFNQAVLRKWGKLGLHGAPTPVLSVTMSLPLVRAEDFVEGFGLIQDLADEIENEHPRIHQFVAYLRRTWLPLKEAVSVFRCPVRTNNLVEGFHSAAPRKLGGVHPNVWIFLNNLKKIIVDQEIDLNRLRDGLTVRRARSRAIRERDRNIAIAQSDLENGRLPVRHFLRKFGHYYRQIQYEAAQEEIDDNVEDETVDPETLDVQREEEPDYEINEVLAGDLSVMARRPMARGGRGRGRARRQARRRGSRRGGEEERIHTTDELSDLTEENLALSDSGGAPGLDHAVPRVRARGRPRGRPRGRAGIRGRGSVELPRGVLTSSASEEHLELLTGERENENRPIPEENTVSLQTSTELQAHVPVTGDAHLFSSDENDSNLSDDHDSSMPEDASSDDMERSFSFYEQPVFDSLPNLVLQPDLALNLPPTLSENNPQPVSNDDSQPANNDNDEEEMMLSEDNGGFTPTLSRRVLEVRGRGRPRGRPRGRGRARARSRGRACVVLELSSDTDEEPSVAGERSSAFEEQLERSTDENGNENSQENTVRLQTTTGDSQAHVPDEDDVYVLSSDEDDYRVPSDDYGFWIPGVAPPENMERPFLFYQQPVPVSNDNAQPASIGNAQPATNDNAQPAINDNAQTVQDICCTCLSSIATHIFTPCGHFCCCQSCVEDLSSPRCPLCNRNYSAVIRVIRT